MKNSKTSEWLYQILKPMTDLVDKCDGEMTWVSEDGASYFVIKSRDPHSAPLPYNKDYSLDVYSIWAGETFHDWDAHFCVGLHQISVWEFHTDLDDNPDKKETFAEYLEYLKNVCFTPRCTKMQKK